LKTQQVRPQRRLLCGEGAVETAFSQCGKQNLLLLLLLLVVVVVVAVLIF